jgi:hypothetical protein
VAAYVAQGITRGELADALEAEVLRMGRASFAAGRLSMGDRSPFDPGDDRVVAQGTSAAREVVRALALSLLVDVLGARPAGRAEPGWAFVGWVAGSARRAARDGYRAGARNARDWLATEEALTSLLDTVGRERLRVKRAKLAEALRRSRSTLPEVLDRAAEQAVSRVATAAARHVPAVLRGDERAESMAAAAFRAADRANLVAFRSGRSHAETSARSILGVAAANLRSPLPQPDPSGAADEDERRALGERRPSPVTPAVLAAALVVSGNALTNALPATAQERVATAIDDAAGAAHLVGEMGAARGAAAVGARVVVWWQLGIAVHCKDCIALSDLSPYYLDVLEGNGTFPGSGHTRCGLRCRCYLVFESEPLF